MPKHTLSARAIYPIEWTRSRIARLVWAWSWPYLTRRMHSTLCGARHVVPRCLLRRSAVGCLQAARPDATNPNSNPNPTLTLTLTLSSGIFKLCDATKDARGGFYFGEYKEADHWGLDVYLPLGLFMLLLLLAKAYALSQQVELCLWRRVLGKAKSKQSKVASVRPKKGGLLKLGGGTSAKATSKPKGKMLSGKL